MKIFLLLLALELATSNKLDRTYLPPPGAKLAGGSSTDLQTPLEYPKETYPRTIQAGQNALQENTITRSAINQGLDDGMLKPLVPIDFSTSTYSNDFSQTTSFPTGVNDATKPSIVSYDNFPPKSFDVDSSSYKSQQFYSAPSLSTEPGFEVTSNTNDFNIPVTNGGSFGYYYFAPAELKTFGNDKINQERSYLDSSNDPNSAIFEYPQENNGYLSVHGQNFKPRPANAKDIVQNYQPSAFGYYGGNPMIMTSQNSSPQMFGKELTTKYGEYESNLPTMPLSISHNKQPVNGGGSVVPFQTPLVGMNVLNPKKSSVTSSVAPQDQTQYQFDKKDTFIGLEQRISAPVRSKIRPERPQAESDRNSVIINYENVISPEGYLYSFDTSNGIHKDESGTAIHGVKAKGSYSYTGDDGKIYSVTYTADENGFQPKGDHLPTPPPIPEAIKKVIEQAARDRAAGIVDDGSYDENKYGHMNYQGAMGRYRPDKGSQYPNVNQKPISKLSKPNGAQKGTNSIPDNKDVISLENDKKASNTEFTYNRPTNFVSEQIESRNGLSTQIYTDKPNKDPIRGQNIPTSRPAFGLNDNQQLLFNENNNDVSLKPNNIKQKSFNNNDGQVRYENDKFIPFVSKYNQNGNLENQTTDKLFQTQSPVIRNMTKNMDTSVYNQGQRNQVTQINPGLNKQLSSNSIKSYDNGYFYVPPKVKFQRKKPFSQSSQQPFNRNNAFVTTSIPTQPDFNTTDKKPTGLDGTRSQILLNTENVINDSTRKPYISGPDDHDGSLFYEDTQPKFLIPGQNDKNLLTTYNNDLDSSNYVYTTTTIPPQAIQFGNQPTDGYNINQFHQTTINPISFDKTLPNTLENRLYIPEGTPRISVSQDFVTSTYRPGTFSEGINLEVNQNVKIYGVGRPTDVTLAYPDKVSTYTDRFYTSSIPEEESRFSGTYSEMYNEGPAPDDKVIQGTDQGVTYGNDIFSTGSPVTGIDTGLTGYYYPNPDRERQPYVDTVENPKNSTSIQNDFGFIPSEDKTTPIYTLGRSPTERVIGEDFSGPKQPQRFDPETGYHY